MGVVAWFDPHAAVPLQAQWALWFAAARREALVLLVPRAGGDSAVVRARAAIEAHAAFALVGEGSEADEGESTEDADEPAELCGKVRVVDEEDADAVRAAIGEALPNLLLLLLGKLDAKDSRTARIGREVLPRVSCAVAVVRLGDGDGAAWPPRHLLAPASRGSHPRAALRLAQQLVRAVDGRLTGVYVEPDIGGFAQSVGENVLGKVLHGAFDDGTDQVGRRVVIDSSVERGLQRAVEHESPDAIVLGTPHVAVLGPRFHGLTPARLCRRVDVPVVMLREALPVGNRLRRRVEEVLRRFVPQLDRETRVELATRVQSSSAWKLRFRRVDQRCRPTIAAFGLLLDSAPR